MENEHELSSPKGVDGFERLIAPLTPREMLEVYQLSDAEEREEIKHLVRSKIAQSREHWSEAERDQIGRLFGIHLLPAPGPVGPRAA